MKYRLGIIFKTSREAAGYSQEQAAEMLGRSVRTISDYERDITLPGIEAMLNMAKVYNDPLLLYKLVDQRFADINYVSPTEGVMKILDVMQNVMEQSRDLIKVAADNVIEDSEMDIWNRGMELADQMIFSGLVLKNVRTERKKPLQGGHLVRATN